MSTGLVLSGGGIRGVAHIGLLKALDELNISPEYVAGTSAGAIVGVLYAGGVKWDEILHFFKVIPIFHSANFTLSKPGFIDTDKFYQEFKKYLPDDTFNALEKTLFVTATDLVNGQLKIFHKGEVIRPVLASASFPGVFSPVHINGNVYVDGGVMNNFPVEPLLTFCDQVIGSYVNPLGAITPEQMTHSYNILERSGRIKSASDSLAKFGLCDVMVSPVELSAFGIFDMSSIDEIFEIGYSSARKALVKHFPEADKS